MPSKPEHSKLMCRVVATYIGTPQSRFDLDYYRTSHLAIAKALLGPHGLESVRVLSDLEPGASSGPQMIVVSEMMFRSRNAFEQAIAAKGEALFADLANFTDVTPLIQICGNVLEA